MSDLTDELSDWESKSDPPDSTGGEASPMMELAPNLGQHAPNVPLSPRSYWRAQGMADAVQREFDQALANGDAAAMRDGYYLLASYYMRTIAILRHALGEHRELLARAALHNLVALHSPLDRMHHAAPDTVPIALTLERDLRRRFMEDLIIRVLHEAPEPLDIKALTQRVNDLDFLADASEATIGLHLDNLLASGHLQTMDGAYRLTGRPYRTVNLGQAALETLAGSQVYRALDRMGFDSLTAIAARKGAFTSAFAEATGCGPDTGALFVAAAELLAGHNGNEDLQPWRHADLIGSSYPRPYQYQAYAIFRGYGYRGQVIEAPTGSGKTMIGMMCIQDWLRRLSEGQSILVLVPTVNYQQQWLAELCHKPAGLRLAPHLVFTGTPAGLEHVRQREAIAPPITIMTYAALAQTSSGRGKGGFDIDSIEMFLQGNNVQYVILDEVHKVVENLSGISAEVTRALTQWVGDGSINGLIGFSGTAAAYRSRFAALGLQLVHVMPAAALIAYGFVAPFAEFGVPFAYSDRERRIRDLIETYKGALHEFLALVGSAHLRRWFTEIPIEQRISLGRDVLRMYAGRSDQDEALKERFITWQQGDELSLVELPLVRLVQIAQGWSDQDLVAAVAAEPSELSDRQSRFEEIRQRLETAREQMQPLFHLADTRRRLSAEGFGTTLDAEALRHLPSEPLTVAQRAARARDLLATTIAGLYHSLGEWYLQVGEGRVDTIKAIIEAERASRPVHGVIVFDDGRRIRWQDGTAAPGYGGVAGLFGQMLGDPRFTPMAVLSSEIYLAYDETDPLPPRIADYIRRVIMHGELGDSLFNLVTQAVGLSDRQLAILRESFDALLTAYVDQLAEVHAARPDEFRRRVLNPFRREVRRRKLGSPGAELLTRLSVRQHYLRNWIETFFNYSLIAGTFARAHLAHLQQVSGATQRFFVVRMAEGQRKQLMYDLTARIVDADELGVDMIIVSPWARTGWNVIKPNLLIDATATRDVTAWQQLRGRAMRAMRTWNNECYRVLLLLLGSRVPGPESAATMPGDVAAAMAQLQLPTSSTEVLDQASRALLKGAHQLAGGAELGATLIARIERGSLAEVSPEEREQLAVELMLARNKVTHIYELVKASGSRSQIFFDRSSHRWERTRAITAKHGLEFAVSPLTGRYSAGEEHAPLVYAGDPRRDVPSELQAHLVTAMEGADLRIVKGWLTAMTTGAHGEIALE